jgi:diguanylate cyclase (GGDEF)-like protein
MSEQPLFRQPMQFADPAKPAGVHPGGDPWPILVVDDDATVHEVTRLILSDYTFDGRPAELTSAYSAAEARGYLQQQPERYALILLDVVMETEDAGLKLVEFIREELHNHEIRIVLRTGQPGLAPEQEVISRYDINDYRAKSELTAVRLFTTITAALRAYRHIMALNRQQRGLRRALAAVADQFSRNGLQQYALGTLQNLESILETPLAGLLCLTRADQEAAEWIVPEGSDQLTHDLQQLRSTLVTLVDAARLHADQGAGTASDADRLAITVATQAANELAIAVVGRSIPPNEALDLAMLFLRAVGAGLDVLLLSDELKNTNAHLEEQVVERTAALTAANRELEQLATRDPLTGVGNRRHFNQVSNTEMARMRRYGHPLALMLIDLDHFKQLNDHYGHAAGDATLKAFCAALLHMLRATDFIGRIGGEEFAVLLPETGLDKALLLAERARQAIEALRVATGDATVTLTASFGVTTVDPIDADIESALQRADAALYRAKNDGRNRVVLAE